MTTKKHREPLDEETTANLDRVDEGTIDGYLRAFHLWDGVERLALKAKVQRLETFFAAAFDPVHFKARPELEAKIVLCDVGDRSCDGESYVDLQRCPFCGTEDPPEDQARKPPEETVIALLRELAGQKVAPPKVVMPAPKVEPKPKATPLALVAPPKSAEPVAPAMLEVIEPQTNRVVTAEELDAALEKVRHLHGQTVQHLYELACELHEMHEKQLWRQRRDADGHPVYGSWNAFVEAELAPFGISRNYSYELISCAKAYPREQFAKLGPAKMKLLLQLPAAERAPVIEEAMQQGTSLSAMREQIAERKADAPATADLRSEQDEDADDKPAGKQRERARPQRAKDNTATFVSSSSVIENIEFETTKGRGHGRVANISGGLKDLPVAVMEGVNGMTMKVALSADKKGVIRAAIFFTPASA